MCASDALPLPLTQGPVGRHDDDSDGLCRPPGLNGEDKSLRVSLGDFHVLEPKGQQILATQQLLPYQTQNGLVVLGLLLEAVETAQERHQFYLQVVPDCCAIPEGSYLWNTEPRHLPLPVPGSPCCSLRELSHIRGSPQPRRVGGWYQHPLLQARELRFQEKSRAQGHTQYTAEPGFEPRQPDSRAQTLFCC